MSARKIDKSLRKTQHISICVSDAEMDSLYDFAEAHRYEPSTYFREILMALASGSVILISKDTHEPVDLNDIRFVRCPNA